MLISGFGNTHPQDATINKPNSVTNLLHHDITFPMIPRGCGKSYGDSAVFDNVLDMQSLNHFIAFNDGVLECYGGTTLHDIVNTFVPKGWFLPVTPGTQFVTVGGAIASDIHGKNHHHVGTFSEHVTEITLWLGDEDLLTITPKSHPELWNATCGGQGLTGAIVKAKINLIPISSAYIKQQNIKSPSLKETMTAFEEHHDAPYSVAWIDSRGRSILMLGEHSLNGDAIHQHKTALNVPVKMPIINQYFVKMFNNLYFRFDKNQTFQTSLQSFFYPLDRLHNWNNLYGKKGLVQYQFVLPLEYSFEGISKILGILRKEGVEPSLSVLKKFGSGNDNYLSFPIGGYTLAMDFKATEHVLKILDLFDDIVMEHGGKLYLTKDARMQKETFHQMHPKWEQFKNVLKKYNIEDKWQSNQRNRLW
mgnify:CR=1 FL=1